MQMSYHAAEQIAHRGITEHEVSDAISFGAHWPSIDNPEVTYARRGDLIVVYNRRGTWVLTSYRVSH